MHRRASPYDPNRRVLGIRLLLLISREIALRNLANEKTQTQIHSISTLIQIVPSSHRGRSGQSSAHEPCSPSTRCCSCPDDRTQRSLESPTKSEREQNLMQERFIRTLVPEAWTIFCFISSLAVLSVEARKRVPISTPSAPSVRAEAIPRPSTIPPQK